MDGLIHLASSNTSWCFFCSQNPSGGMLGSRLVLDYKGNLVRQPKSRAAFLRLPSRLHGRTSTSRLPAASSNPLQLVRIRIRCSHSSSSQLRHIASIAGKPHPTNTWTKTKILHNNRPDDAKPVAQGGPSRARAGLRAVPASKDQMRSQFAVFQLRQGVCCQHRWLMREPKRPIDH